VVHGTARSYSPAVRDTIERTLCQLAEGIATAHGCTALVEYDRRYPPLVNAVEQTRIAAAAASVLVTPEKVNTEMSPSTAAEDFSFMLQAKPGAFIWIGNGVRPDGCAHGLHSPLYDFNDDILALGAAYWVSLVDQELGDTAD
jgi:metal-dependent amidase/aminoacylase/carboxypeptidase family protein